MWWLGNLMKLKIILAGVERMGAIQLTEGDIISQMSSIVKLFNETPHSINSIV